MTGRKPVEVVTASELQAPPEAVWARVASLDGVNHERTLQPLGDGGTCVTDRIRFVPRLPGTACVHRAVIAAIFPPSQR